MMAQLRHVKFLSSLKKALQIFSFTKTFCEIISDFVQTIISINKFFNIEKIFSYKKDFQKIFSLLKLILN